MKQFLLAAVLILVPVGCFTAFNIWYLGAASATASLGDLSPMKTIVADVQKIAASGDFKAAAARVTDWETAWDDAEAGMRPLNPEAWGRIDAASDAALNALRQGTPSPDTVMPALATLMATLDNPTGK